MPHQHRNRVFLPGVFFLFGFRRFRFHTKNEELSKFERKKMSDLAGWLKKATLWQFLGWFDCVETVTVRNKRAKFRWSTECTERDRLVLQMLEENMSSPSVAG